MKLDPATAITHYCRSRGYPEPDAEVVFHPSRKWRLDWAWRDRQFAVEVHGGVWTGGRHTRGRGFTNDCEKMAWAAVLGWRVVPVTTGQIADGTLWAVLDREFQGGNQA